MLIAGCAARWGTIAVPSKSPTEHLALSIEDHAVP